MSAKLSHRPGTVPALPVAKTIVTIPIAWRLLGIRPVPKNCGCTNSPLRPDKGPSFSIFESEDGTSRFKDHATGECGDVVTFVERASRCTTADAIKWVRLVAYLWLLPEDDPMREALVKEFGLGEPQFEPAHQVRRFVADTVLPDIFRAITGEELASIVNARGFQQDAGLMLAVEREMLLACQTSEGPAWVMTDARRLHASRRLFSGHAFEGGMKAKTVRGSCAGWPIGLADAKNRRHIVLCEGGPDTLAAFTLLAESAKAGSLVGDVADHGVVMMGGATCSIVEEALALFADKAVTMVPHLDAAGQTGAAKWKTQLESHGAHVRVFDLAPHLADGGKDLNDALRANPTNLNLFASHE